jgi:protein O-mannosyl-transferase
MPTANAIKKRKKQRRQAAKQLTPKPQLVPQQRPTIQPQAVQPEVATAPVDDSLDFRNLRAAPAILLAFITLAVFYQALHHPFANYDDADYVLENTHIHKGLTFETLKWALTSTERANWHPITWLSHAVDWKLFGADPAGHHLTSLLFHIANVLLLYFFLDRITHAKLRSLAVAALFAIHPLNVESVVWIAERKNVLCMLFFLLTLFAYSSYARQPNLWRYLLVALGLALGLASKPMLVTVPLVLLLVDFWPLQRVQGWTQPSSTFPVPQAPLWRLVLEKLPLLALSAADSVITMIAQRQVNAVRGVTTYSLKDRLGNAILSYADYLWKLIWPSHLAVFYPHPAGHLKLWEVVLCGLFLAAASYLVWRERSRPYLLMGWCWFLGTLVPVIGLVQVGDQGMANRYMYLPAIGVFIMAVWGLGELIERIPKRLHSYVGAAVAVAMVVYAVVAVAQVRTWRDNLSLWSQVLRVDGNNASAEDVVGSEILVNATNQGLAYSAEAQVHFQHAVQINPKDSVAILNIGADYLAHGKLQESLQKFQLALQYANDPIIKYRTLTNMGSAYERLADMDTSRKYFRQAMAVGVKDDPTAFVGFARTFTDEQIAKLKKTLPEHPTAADAPSYVKLGQLQEAGNYDDDAKLSYQHALTLDANFVAARTALDKLTARQQQQ